MGQSDPVKLLNLLIDNIARRRDPRGKTVRGAGVDGEP